MAIQLISGNLNQWGDLGRYEADSSTWGFNSATFGNIQSRSNEQAYAGLYSKKIFCPGGFSLGERIIDAARYTGVNGKFYLARVRVFTPTADQVASDGCIFTFENTTIPFLDLETTRTVADAKGTWVEVEGRWTHGITVGDIYLRILQNGGGNTLQPYSPVYVDKFEIYEFEEVVEEPPPPVEEETDDVYWSRNPITKPMTAVTPSWDTLDNFRLFCDVRVEETADSNTYSSVLKVALTPFTNGSNTFQVREAFRKVLTAAPPEGIDTIERLTDRIKRFKLFTGEVSGVTEEPVTLTESAPNIVVMGGLSKFKWPGFNYFTTFLTANKKFLTWAPVVKPVDRNQDDYLNFFVWKTDTVTLKLQLTCYYDDDTTETDVVLTRTGVLFQQLYQIPAGPANSGALMVNPAKNLLRYELELLDQADALISEVRTYVLDAYTHPRKRLFMFLNSLGTYEILRFNGMADASAEVGKEEIVKFLPYNYNPLDGERIVNSAQLRAGASYSSGLFDDEYASEWLDYMKDFLMSRRVYLIENNNLVPVVVSAGSYAMNSDQVYEKVIRFTALNSYQDENYTPAGV